MRSWTGRPQPLGATWDGSGTNFSLFSVNATSVELLFFDGPDALPSERIRLTEKSGFIWHTYLPDVAPGRLYAYSVDGPYEPSKGQRFNKNKALVDPYAKAIAGAVRWDDSLFGYTLGDSGADLSFDGRDSSPFVPKSVVVDPSFDWGGDKPPRTPWEKSLIYELHVRGFTIRHPAVEEGKRGTYAGLASPASIEHMKELGVTAVELMPVHQHVDNRFLLDRGLRNYWGYNTIGYFAPESRYSSTGAMGQQVGEFKSMVKALHEAGLEVILDVVYNHTAEGNELGPTLSFKGIDNRAYYRLQRRDLRHYFDATGAGNTLNMKNPFVVRMIMDSLRYWVTEMHVDGFRFDLAAALARELYEVDFLSALFQGINQDPVLSQVKLIAEPWDVGHGGYRVGGFPPPWGEWNGKYRDAVRRFWKGDQIHLSELATRLAGSSDLYSGRGRGPRASINFVTCHDGFTLWDLVSYNGKHNEANGEGNRDGSSDNHSWNCGHEGPTEDQSIAALRRRQSMNLLATLLLSQGVPMLLAGDELLRTQGGNNNAYCQDNEVSWIDWNAGKPEFLEFVKKLTRIRREHPVFRRKKFFDGKSGTDGEKDLTWLKADGSEVKPEEWRSLSNRPLGILLNGRAMKESTSWGERVTDDSFLLLLNGSAASREFTLPSNKGPWEVVIDTSGSWPAGSVSGTARLPERTLVLLKRSG